MRDDTIVAKPERTEGFHLALTVLQPQVTDDGQPALLHSGRRRFGGQRFAVTACSDAARTLCDALGLAEDLDHLVRSRQSTIEVDLDLLTEAEISPCGTALNAVPLPQEAHVQAAVDMIRRAQNAIQRLGARIFLETA